jgi:hypothetical protein
MLTSISPLGERARGNRFWLTAAAYAVGSLLGGVVVGVALGALGDVLALDDVEAPVRAATVVAAAVVGVVLDATGRLPSLRRQVDERWLATYRGWVYGLGFGLQLGMAVTTIVTASVTYVFLLATFLTASPTAGALAGATFGVARALPLLATARVRTPEDLAHLHRGVARAATPFAIGTRAAQLGAALGALVLLGTNA